MKLHFLLFFGLFTLFSFSQESTVAIDIELKACHCIAQINRDRDEKTQYAKVDSCIRKAIMSNQLLDNLNRAYEMAKDSSLTKQEYNITIDASEGFKELERKLLDNCKALNNILNNATASSDNSYSKDPIAIDHYKNGYTAYNKGNYEQAIIYYKNAVAQDKNFAFAWDMLGASYRRLDQYDQSIDAYQKSLIVDPKGAMPLQNLPIVYRLKKDYDKAVNVYKDYIKYYPEDPEGYFGLSQCGLLLEDYELAADNIFPAYKMYTAVNSPYKQDAELVIGEVYKNMKLNGELDKFMEYAAKHNISIDE